MNAVLIVVYVVGYIGFSVGVPMYEAYKRGEKGVDPEKIAVAMIFSVLWPLIVPVAIGMCLMERFICLVAELCGWILRKMP